MMIVSQPGDELDNLIIPADSSFCYSGKYPSHMACFKNT